MDKDSEASELPSSAWSARIFPSLVTFTLRGFSLKACHRELEGVYYFLRAHPGLRALAINDADDKIIPLLLPKIDHGGNEVATICPNLTLLRFRSDGHYPGGIPEIVVERLSLLLRERPQLNVQWECNVVAAVHRALEPAGHIRGRIVVQESNWWEDENTLPPFHVMDWGEVEESFDQ